jgi:hypothetical protein
MEIPKMGDRRDHGIDRDWAALGAAWRAEDRPLDPLAVRAVIARRAWRSRAIFLVETLIGLAAGALGIMLLLRPWPAWLVGATILLLTIAGLGLAAWTQAALGRGAAGQVRDTLDQGISQARAAIRWGWAGIVLAPGSAFLLAILAFAHGQAAYQPVFPFPFWLKAAVATAGSLVYLALCVAAVRRNRRRLAALLKLRARLFGDEEH